MKRIIDAMVLLAFIFSSVASSANLLPNVEIENVNKKALTDTFIADMTNLGFTQTLSNDHQITFKLGDKNPLTAALVGYTDWFLQADFITLQKEKSVKITVSAQKIGVTKKGALEAVPDDSILWPTYLQYLKIKYNGGQGYGMVLAANPSGRIVAVSKGSDAESQGIQAGYTIVELDNHIVSFLSSSSLEKYLIGPGKTIKAKIRGFDKLVKDYLLVNQYIPAELQGR